MTPTLPESLRTVFDTLPDWVIVHHPERGILYANTALLALLGVSEEAILGRSSLELVHPDDHVAVRERVRFAMESGKPSLPAPLRFVLPGGRVAHGECRGVSCEVGGLDYVLVVIRDLTERRHHEAQAAAGGRLASMGRLAAGVAHEINNPLAYVIGHLEVIRSAMLDDALRARVDEALDGAARVRAIVDDLRSLSRGDDERRAPVDLVRVIDAACNIAEVHVRHRSRLVRDIGPASRVFGNESRLGQLVLNLLLNAAEAIPEGRAAENEIRLSLGTDSSGRVVLAVSDTGVGVQESAIPHLFDPFFTTKPVGVGTGLGLSICHGIVHSLGGEIAVESVVGEGSTFRVTLPASNEVEEPAASAPAASAPRSRVLIIDDEPRVARALADLLGEKHDVDIEVSALRALERFIQGEHFDVICCDLMMPDMTGMDLQDALDERVPELATRTLYMTGGAFTPRARDFLHRIGNRALEKPFSGADVERAIARIRALPS